MKTTNAIVVAAALASAAVFGAAAGTLIAVVNTPCESEDSANCVWDAETRGNGEGRSFLSLRLTDGADPITVYID